MLRLRGFIRVIGQLRDQDLVLRQEFGDLFPVESRRTVHQRGQGNGLRHLPLLGLVRRLGIGDQDVLLPGLAFGRHQHQRDLAGALLLAAQNGRVEEGVALTQVVDGAEREALIACLHSEVERPQRRAGRTRHKRRRLRRRGGRIRLLRP